MEENLTIEHAKEIYEKLKPQWGDLSDGLDIPGSYAEFVRVKWFLLGVASQQEKNNSQSA